MGFVGTFERMDGGFLAIASMSVSRHGHRESQGAARLVAMSSRVAK
jgi:hypothetical protein